VLRGGSLRDQCSVSGERPPLEVLRISRRPQACRRDHHSGGPAVVFVRGCSSVLEAAANNPCVASLKLPGLESVLCASARARSLTGADWHPRGRSYGWRLESVPANRVVGARPPGALPRAALAAGARGSFGCGGLRTLRLRSTRGPCKPDSRLWDRWLVGDGPILRIAGPPRSDGTAPRRLSLS